MKRRRSAMWSGAPMAGGSPPRRGTARRASGTPPQASGPAASRDAATGQLRFALSGHAGLVSDVDWNSDGTRLATAGNDGTARVWEIVPGGPRELLSMSGYDTRKGLQGVAFSPDG